jgi:signal peptidase I
MAEIQNSFLQMIILLSMVLAIRTFVFGLYWVPTGSMEPTMLVGEGFFADKFTILFRPLKRGEIISFNEPTFIYSHNWAIKLFQQYLYGPENWTKRIIGLPGERIQGKIENGKPTIYINEQKFNEPYVNPYPVVNVQENSHQLVLSPLIFASKTNSRYRTFDPQYPLTDPLQPFYRITKDIILPHESQPHILFPNTPAYSCGVTDVFDITLNKDEYFVMGDNRQASFDSRGFGRIKRSIIHGRILFRLFSFDTANSLLYELLTHPIDFIFSKARSWNRWFSWVL